MRNQYMLKSESALLADNMMPSRDRIISSLNAVRAERWYKETRLEAGG
jgi:hypothetical protein